MSNSNTPTTNPHRTTGLSRPCNANDLFTVREGLQCGNCLVLVRDTRQTPSQARHTVRVDFSDGTHLVTDINGTEDEIRDYYRDAVFNHGDTEERPADEMVSVTAVTFLPLPSAIPLPIHHVADDPRDRPLIATCGVNVSALDYPIGSTMAACSPSEVTCLDCLEKLTPRTGAANYEANREARRERYEDLASRKAAESNALFNRAHQMASVIPFGQPILVGHHSEKRDRNYRAKIDNTFSRACQTAKTADHYASKAASVGTAGISSDDPAAVAKLREELTQLEALQARMVAGNKIVRNKKLTDAEKVEQLQALGLKEKTAQETLKPDFCGRIGFPDYALSNNSANIRRIKERIEKLLKEAATRPEETTEADTGPYLLIEDVEDNRLLLQFHQRAPQAVCDLLKRNGFRWAPSKGAWSRQLNPNSRNAEKNIRLEIILACEPISPDVLRAEIEKARTTYDRAEQLLGTEDKWSVRRSNLEYTQRTVREDLRKCLEALTKIRAAEDPSRDWAELMQDPRLI